MKLSDNLQKASARYQDSQSKLASAQRNAPMDTNRGERRATNTPEIQAARTQLGTDRKSLQEAQKKANDYAKKQVEAASKKYKGKFDEKAARQLASVSNPTLSQQAEMRALQAGMKRKAEHCLQGCLKRWKAACVIRRQVI